MADIKPLYEVRQSNALTEARFSLTACQLDIYFYLLSMLKLNDEPEKKYDIYVQQIKEMTGREWNYQQLRESTKDLLTKVIEFDDAEGNFCQTSLISSSKYFKGKGYVSVTVSYIIRPLLWELKNRFTSFQLYCALAMTSKFAKRIYLICSEWKNNLTEGQKVAMSKIYTVDELRFMLGLTDPQGIEPDQFKQWGQFEEKVLKIAKNQINTYSDLNIGYKATKQGRSYQLIQFSIKKGNEHQLLIDFNQEDLQERLEQVNKKIVLIDQFKLSEKQADIVVRRLETSAVRAVLEAVNEAVKAGKVKNIGSYTVASLRNQFGIEL
jgi:plasmid replication initiation protein